MPEKHRQRLKVVCQFLPNIQWGVMFVRYFPFAIHFYKYEGG